MRLWKSVGRHWIWRNWDGAGWPLLIACFRAFAVPILSLPGAARTVIERLSRSVPGMDLRCP